MTGGIPSMITVSGVVMEQTTSGATPLAGVALNAFIIGNDATPIATATTDAQGAYTASVTTNGKPVDAYLKATKTGYVDSYVYPAAPLTANFAGANIGIVSTSTFGTLRSILGGTAGKGMMIMIVSDPNNNPISGATVATAPASASYRYLDANGQPFGTTSTNPTGVAFAIDVPPGNVTVNATKSGMTFQSHALNARADVMTTTLIVGH